jgi:ceramide synthetase
MFESLKEQYELAQAGYLDGESNPSRDLLLVFMLVGGLTIAQIKLSNHFQRLACCKKSAEKSKKVFESVWYCLLHTSSFLWGMAILNYEDWPLETKYFWINYPFHPFSVFFRIYYIFEVSFYIHQAIILFFFDYKRKDYYELVTHHLVTIALIGISFILRHFRIGLVILLIHDASDIFLYLAKIFHYLQRVKHTDLTFGTFAFVFLITRLFLFPYVVYSIFWEPQIYHDNIDRFWPQIIFWKSALSTLQILHVIWFIMISRMIILAFRKGQVQGDIRSDDETEDQDDKHQKSN